MKYKSLTALLALASTACTGYNTVESAPQDQTIRGNGGPVRVTLKDGRELFFGVATLKGDSLIGLANDGPTGRYAVPYSSIKKVETYGFDGAKTTVVVLAFVVGFGGLVSACASTGF